MTLRTRRTLYRLRNHMNSPEGVSTIGALVTLAGIVTFFWSHAK